MVQRLQTRCVCVGADGWQKKDRERVRVCEDRKADARRSEVNTYRSPSKSFSPLAVLKRCEGKGVATAESKERGVALDTCVRVFTRVCFAFCSCIYALSLSFSLDLNQTHSKHVGGAAGRIRRQRAGVQRPVFEGE